MSSRNIQLAALLAAALLVVSVLWYQSGEQGLLRTDVTAPGDPYGYSPEYRVTNSGLPELHYLVPFAQEVVLDGLQMPAQVPSLTTSVQWIPDNPAQPNVVLGDAHAVRTSFIAPAQVTDLKFLLQVNTGTAFQAVARYVFHIVSRKAFEADVNGDGKYSFPDLVALLQHWDQYGDQALPVLAIVLSRYEGQ